MQVLQSLVQEPIMPSMHNSLPSLLWQTMVNRLVYSVVLALGLLVGSMPWCVFFVSRNRWSLPSINRNSVTFVWMPVPGQLSKTLGMRNYGSACTYFFVQFTLPSELFAIAIPANHQWIRLSFYHTGQCKQLKCQKRAWMIGVSLEV